MFLSDSQPSIYRFPGCFCLFGVFLAFPLLAAIEMNRADRDDIQAIADAHDAREAGMQAMRSFERDLVFLLDFEQDNTAYLSGGRLDVPFEPAGYVQGRYGRGFYFDRWRQNLLPEQVAPIGLDLTGLRPIGPVELRSVETDTPVGHRALVVEPDLMQIDAKEFDGGGFATETVRRPMTGALRWGYANLIGSAYVKGPQGAMVTIRVDLDPEPDAVDNDDYREDAFTPRTVTLEGGWQRIAAHVSIDGKHLERSLRLEILYGPGAETPDENDRPLPVLHVSGLKVELASYPGFPTLPTPWIPGDTSHGPTYVTISEPMVRNAFPADHGTLAFWVRHPDDGIPGRISGASYVNFGPWQIARGNVALPGLDRVSDVRGMMPGIDTDDWHHFALTWQGEQVRVYFNGERTRELEREIIDIEDQRERYYLRIGGAPGDRDGGRAVTAANAAMDEVAIFRRALSPAEVAELAGGAIPLRPTAGRLLLGSASPRTTLYRDEDRVSLPFTVEDIQGGHTAWEVITGLDEHLSGRTRLELENGTGTLTVALSPRQLAPGSYTLSLAATPIDQAGATPEVFTRTLHVAPALCRHRFRLSTWQSNPTTVEWRDFYDTLGVNTIDTRFGPSIDLDAFGRRGHGFNLFFSATRRRDFSPEGRAATRDEIGSIADAIAPFPNWQGSLINTETGAGRLPPEATREAWFDAWLKTAYPEPVPDESLWILGGPHAPTQCEFGDEDPLPDDQGIFDAPPAGLRFLRWWYGGGGTQTRLNAMIAEEIKTRRPDIVTWTDAGGVNKGMLSGMEAASMWTYRLDPGMIYGDLEAAHATIRPTGKKFYATLGMWYRTHVNMRAEMPDGKTRLLAPTADDAIQQAWITIGLIPSDGLNYWRPDFWFQGMRGSDTDYAEPDSVDRLGRVFHDDLIPLGTLLKGVGADRAPLAVLHPEPWLTAGSRHQPGGRWNWQAWHYSQAWRRWLGAAGIPYDYLTDADLDLETLTSYPAILLPGATLISRRTYDLLTAAGESGTRIIVDGHTRQEYPNMERWEQYYFHRWPGSRPEHFEFNGHQFMTEETRAGFERLHTDLARDSDVSVEGVDGPVFYRTRMADGVRYVVIVNNRRREGPYTEWLDNPEVRPYGQAQKARVSLNVPETAAIYEFTESQRLAPQSTGERLNLEIDLPPHAGRVLCIYPVALREIEILLPDDLARGYAKRRNLTIRLIDENGDAAPGCQLLEVSIEMPDGQRYDGSGRFRTEHGTAAIPFNPALNHPAGPWRIHVMERTTGLTETLTREIQ